MLFLALYAALVLSIKNFLVDFHQMLNYGGDGSLQLQHKADAHWQLRLRIFSKRDMRASTIKRFFSCLKFLVAIHGDRGIPLLSMPVASANWGLLMIEIISVIWTLTYDTYENVCLLMIYLWSTVNLLMNYLWYTYDLFMFYL